MEAIFMRLHMLACTKAPERPNIWALIQSHQIDMEMEAEALKEQEKEEEDEAMLKTVD
jgi:hypothetical protein